MQSWHHRPSDPAYPVLRPQASRRRRSGLAALISNWRAVLVVLATIALVAFVLPGVAGKAASAPAGLQASGNDPAVGKVPATESPVPTAAPTPTEGIPGVRPLAIPTMLPVVDRGPAPARDPGTPDPDPTTDHVIVVDGESGAVLFQRNAYEPVAPASLTKIMTAILGIEHGNLDDQITVDVDARKLGDSTVMGLEPGFQVTLQDLLYGLMLPSGNDAALAIARYVAGSDDRFVELMNWRAKSLGLKSTHFVNPHGLDADGHYSCPADMVTMARYAMQYPIFRTLAAARSYDISHPNLHFTVWNLNPILGAYPGADGVKIGYTDNAGKAMVGTADRDGHRVYVAYMKSESGTVPETAGLFDWAYNSFTWAR